MTLREFLDNYESYYSTDLERIQAYIAFSGFEQEAIVMMSNLATMKFAKMKQEDAALRGHVSMLALSNYRDYYPDEIADKLQWACYSLEVGVDISKTSEWGWFEKNVPEIDISNKLMWRPLVEYFHSHGLYFKKER